MGSNNVERAIPVKLRENNNGMRLQIDERYDFRLINPKFNNLFDLHFRLVNLLTSK